MIKTFWKNLPIRILGTMAVVLGATTADPVQATKLTGFETNGGMMGGMRVTVNFFDGTTETSIWNPTNIPRLGQAVGNGWSLRQFGNTHGSYYQDYDNTWTFNYSGGSKVSNLIIDALYGNTVFDLGKEIITEGSADGWNFQVKSGTAPDWYGYSGDVDISKGDLFGRLSMSWTNGFSGTLKFLADTDSSSEPVGTKQPLPPPPPAPNVAPTLIGLAIPNYVINEGQSASATLYATDPNPNPVTFFLNGQSYTDWNSSGTRAGYFNLGTFANQGVVDLIGQAVDNQGAASATANGTLTIRNVAPTLTSFALNGSESDIVIDEGQSVSATLAGTDPGLFDDIGFYIDGNHRGTDPTDTLGVRGIGTEIGTFYDDGTVSYTATARDELAESNAITRTVTVRNVAPTLTGFDFLTDTIDQGQTAFANLLATDPGTDPITFLMNDAVIGADPTLSGTRSLLNTNLGIFNTPGTYTFRAQAQDDDFGFSQLIEKTLTVRNVGPTITNVTAPLTVLEDQPFDVFASAIDPGVNDILTYEWDWNNDGQTDWASTDGTLQASFDKSGVYTIGLKVSDGYGGVAYQTVDVTVSHVPEPSAVLGLLAFSAVGAGSLRKRKQQ